MTTLRSYTGPSTLLPVGGAWAFLLETRDSNGYRTSLVAPVLAVTTPAGASVPVALTSTSPGVWSGTYVVAAAGRHLAHASTPEDAFDLSAYAALPTAESGMPDVNAVAHYLGNRAGTWSTADMQDALDAERSAQRDVCTVPAVYPDSLRQALLRRVQRNLAMRALPLAVPTGDAQGGPAIVPGRDPEVRRLEAPHPRLVVG